MKKKWTQAAKDEKKRQQQKLNKQSFISAKIIKCVKGKMCVFFFFFQTLNFRRSFKRE